VRAAWVAYAARAMGYQATLLLSGVYFLVLGPSALAARLAGKRLLDLSHASADSTWGGHRQGEKTLPALERPF
jgi:hypothetical protein